MKVANIKSDRQFRTYDWRPLRIQTYGENNDFPQAVSEIMTASRTGSACLDIYRDFVLGSNFTDESVGKIVVNKKGQTLNRIRKRVTDDYTKYGGVAIHVNYNMLYKIKSMCVIPFEHTRLGLADDDGNITEIAVHEDWGRRESNNYLWKPGKIKRYPIFNPDPEVIEAQAAQAGSWEDYQGQIFWWSGEELEYPLPKYIAEMTDMRTEEGLANVTSRNVCSNFMLAGILVDILSEDLNDQQIMEKQKALMQFQGDERALQLWYTTAKSKEEIPVFVPFSGENYDKAFTNTSTQIPDNIGQAFKQPPILRAKDVGANFGADLMINAYKFYNSVTSRDRQNITEIFSTLFEYWWAPLNTPQFDINPLIFNDGAFIYDRIGAQGMQQILDVVARVTSGEINVEQGRNMLKIGYGLTESESIKFLPNDTEA